MGWFFEDFDPQATPVVTPEKTISETDALTKLRIFWIDLTNRFMCHIYQ